MFQSECTATLTHMIVELKNSLGVISRGFTSMAEACTNVWAKGVENTWPRACPVRDWSSGVMDVMEEEPECAADAE